MGTAALVALGTFILLLSVSLAVAGLVFAQRRVPLEFRKAHNDTMGSINAVLHVTFGVIIGFTAFLVLDKYSTAQRTAVSEAGDIVVIHRLANSFAEPHRGEIQELAKSYAQEVVDEEWPLMREGRSSARAEELAEELGRSIQDFEPGTQAETAAHAQALSGMRDLTRDRDVRLFLLYAGLPPILWVVLGVLAALIIVLTYFLGMENARLHMWAVGTLTVGIALVFFTIVVLDHPFGGGFRVGPGAFERALSTMEGAGEQNT